MKQTFTLFIGFLAFSANAQDILFERMLPLPPAPQNYAHIIQTNSGAHFFADIDGDNDLDLLVSGNTYQGAKTELYRNNGLGTFTLIEDTPFPDVFMSAVAFADVDGDNDLDVLISGRDELNQNYYCNLFLNDGNGNYTLVEDTPFPGNAEGAIAFADIDGDSDLDLLLSGRAGATVFTNLYTNDGAGNFSLVEDTPFPGMYQGTLDFADIDGDNDPDILITGRDLDGSTQSLGEIYTNDGFGNFTLMENTPLHGYFRSATAFADIDNDDDLDLLIFGVSDCYTPGLDPCALYTNDGNGNYTLVENTPFPGLTQASVRFADIDGDQDQDVIISGRYDGLNSLTKLFINDGTGVFIPEPETPFNQETQNAIGFADFDGDDDLDLLLTRGGEFQDKGNFFMNDGQGNFTLVENSPFPGVVVGANAFADIDGDQDMDIIISGYTSDENYITEIYINNGEGNYYLDDETSISGFAIGSLAFADMDGDNDLDLLISGLSDNGPLTEYYLNDGSGNFTLVNETPFPAVYGSSIGFADVNGDNHLDLLISGMEATFENICRLYMNDGSGSYTQAPNLPFEAVSRGSISFADIDGDNDLDVFISGAIYFDWEESVSISNIYINDGSGAFTLLDGTPFPGVYHSASAFADIDGDNDQDLLLTGLNENGEPISKLYTNDGLGNFTEVSNPFIGVSSGTVNFSDVDGDNDQDVLITGRDTTCCYWGENHTLLYINDGTGVFSLAEDMPFEHVSVSAVAIGDIDGDGGHDILISGGGKGPSTILWQNVNCIPALSTEYSDICTDGSITVNGNVYDASNPTGIETFIGGEQNGCDSTVYINLNVIPPVDVNIEVTGASLQVMNGYSNYQWIDCDNNSPIFGENSSTFTAIENGNYAVEVTENGCITVSECTTVTLVSVQNHTFGQEISVYPNPSSGSVFLKLEEEIRNAEIRVYSTTGVLMSSFSGNLVSGMPLPIDPNLSGIYVVKIETDDKLATFRVTKV